MALDLSVRVLRPALCGALGLLMLASTACSSDDADPPPKNPEFPATNEMMNWIQLITEQGIRRAGYPANQWTESWAAQQFRQFGLQDVTLEPVQAVTWMPKSCALEVWVNVAPTETTTLPCFHVPYSKLSADVVLPLAEIADGDVTDKAAVVTAGFLTLPQTAMITFSNRHYDPTGEFQTMNQTLPFTRGILNVLEPSIEAGASAFIGVLDVPWETHDYFVPYDAAMRPIPGVWISKSVGTQLRALVARGPASVRVKVESTAPAVETYNIVGTLPGATADSVIFGSHHDGPWASAVEDASGIALVLAQARYWSAVPRAERPFTLKFLLQAAHVAGYPGATRYVEEHRAELAQTVVEIHLEHVARLCEGRDGTLVPTDEPEVRWWFTSESKSLEDAVEHALIEQGLTRSLIIGPNGFPPGAEAPPTDGSRFHLAGVPIMNFLTAPMYLFDSQDTIDKVHEPSLLPISRAVVSMVEELRGQTAASIRAEIPAPAK